MSNSHQQLSEDQIDAIPLRYEATILPEQPPTDQGGILLQVRQSRNLVAHAKEHTLKDLNDGRPGQRVETFLGSTFQGATVSEVSHTEERDTHGSN